MASAGKPVWTNNLKESCDVNGWHLVREDGRLHIGSPTLDQTLVLTNEEAVAIWDALWVLYGTTAR